MPNKFTPELIHAAIEGFQYQKRRLDEQIADLRQMLDGNAPEPAAVSEPRRRGRRKMSAAARARISEAQRKRWAQAKGSATPAKAAAKPKRKLSAAGRKRIIEATKARWARVRAEAANKSGATKGAGKRGRTTQTAG